MVMHFVIVGCGRVGMSLSNAIENMGHSVAIIDNNCESFKLLPKSFKGKKVIGYGFDANTLKRA
jgi:trk system potassium uptake protein TrkA